LGAISDRSSVSGSDCPGARPGVNFVRRITRSESAGGPHDRPVANFPWGALARLGLARAYALQRDPAKARAAYQDFLGLWKDADPDVPILKEAKAEYAKLQ